MMRRIPVFAVLIFLASLVTPPAAWAEPYALVRGVDNADLRERLQAVIGETPSPPAGPREARDRAASAAERTLRALRSEGYYAARAEPRVEPGSPARAVVVVEPGPRYVFSEVRLRFQGEAPIAVRAAAGAAFGLYAGDPVRAESVIAAEVRAVDALHEAGLPDASAAERVITVDHAERMATALYTLETGPYAEFGEIVLEPGGPLRPEYARSLAPFEPGDPVQHSLLREYALRLNGLRGVSVASATLGEQEPGSRRRTVEVALEAAPRYRVDLGGGYSTSEGLGAEAEIVRRNLFRDADTLTLMARLAQIQSALDLELERPNWGRYGQTLRLGARVESERTDAYDRDAVMLRTRLSRELRPGVAASVGLGLESADTRQTSAAVTGVSGAYNAVTAAAGLVWDARDDPFDPQSGFRAEAQVEPAMIVSGVTVTFARVSAGASAYRAFGEDWVAAGRARLGVIAGAGAADIPADRRFYAGGGGSARGFDYQSLSPLNPDGTPFGGASLLELGFEIRYRYSETWGGVAFIDAAAASRGHAPDLGDLRAAAGLGLRYYTGFGPIRLDLATPLDRRPGETPVHVYISLGQAF